LVLRQQLIEERELFTEVLVAFFVGSLEIGEYSDFER